MTNSNHLASQNAVGQYKTYGFFGGAAFGGVAGILVSGPNFYVWPASQSVGVIAGLTVGMAIIGYLFFGFIIGGSAGSHASVEGQAEIGSSESGGFAGNGAEGSGGGGD